jgi:hypothetical protein
MVSLKAVFNINKEILIKFNIINNWTFLNTIVF